MAKDNRSVLVITTLWMAILCVGAVVDRPCPSQCYCHWPSMTVHCVDLNLTQVPRAVPTDVQHLFLQGNQLQTLGQFTLARFSALRILDVSSNDLQEIHPEAFQNQSDLEILTLDNNTLQRVPWEALGNLNKLYHLSIKNNSIIDTIGNCTVSHLALNKSDDTMNAMYRNESQHQSVSRSDTYGRTLQKCAPQLPSLKKLYLNMNLLQALNPELLEQLPLLQTLDLDGNNISQVAIVLSKPHQKLLDINLANNNIHCISEDSFSWVPFLTSLVLTGNKLISFRGGWLDHLSADKLVLDNNPVRVITYGTFTHCSNLENLTISHMPNLSRIGDGAFDGLSKLQTLSLQRNPQLDYIHTNALSSLHSLISLDLGFSNISIIHEGTFLNLTNLRRIWLQNNPWSCNCDTRWMLKWLNSNGTNNPTVLNPENITCAFPKQFQGTCVQDVDTTNITCLPPNITDYSSSPLVTIGSSLVLDCVVHGDPSPTVKWFTPRMESFEYQLAFSPVYDPHQGQAAFHHDHLWHTNDYYHHIITHEDRIHIMDNGSLYIDYLQRKDAGDYICSVENDYGNDTIVINVRLNYAVIQTTTVISIIIGFATSFCFLILSIIVALIRWAARHCCGEEHEKRKGIKEIIDSLGQFKSDKIDRFSAYKSAKIDQLSTYKADKVDRLSAYKSDKIDKLSAYKTAKVDQLSSFKTDKVDKIRSYKKVAITTLWHHMQALREHYNTQLAKVKDNCNMQAEKLRENYSNQVSRFKGYKSSQVEKIRDNYNNQVMRIREYGSFQANRLRDHYKLQQQHLMKIVEVLDIGNCMTAIEAECLRTESMLFDPDLHLDLDTHPVHISREDSDSYESEYQTAGSNSELNEKESNYSLTHITEDLQGPRSESASRKVHHHKRRRQNSSHSLDSLDDDQPLPSTSRPPHRKRKKKRKLHFIDELYMKAMRQKTLAEAEAQLEISVHLEDHHNNSNKETNIHGFENTPQCQDNTTDSQQSPVSDQTSTHVGNLCPETACEAVPHTVVEMGSNDAEKLPRCESTV